MIVIESIVAGILTFLVGLQVIEFIGLTNKIEDSIVGSWCNRNQFIAVIVGLLYLLSHIR